MLITAVICYWRNASSSSSSSRCAFASNRLGYFLSFDFCFYVLIVQSMHNCIAGFSQHLNSNQLNSIFSWSVSKDLKIFISSFFFSSNILARQYNGPSYRPHIRLFIYVMSTSLKISCIFFVDLYIKSQFPPPPPPHPFLFNGA